MVRGVFFSEDPRTSSKKEALYISLLLISTCFWLKNRCSSEHLTNKTHTENVYFSLRIHVCPKNPGFSLHSYKWYIGTFNPREIGFTGFLGPESGSNCLTESHRGHVFHHRNETQGIYSMTPFSDVVIDSIPEGMRVFFCSFRMFISVQQEDVFNVKSFLINEGLQRLLWVAICQQLFLGKCVCSRYEHLDSFRNN